MSALGKRPATLDEARASARALLARHDLPYTREIDASVVALWFASVLEELEVRHVA